MKSIKSKKQKIRLLLNKLDKYTHYFIFDVYIMISKCLRYFDANYLIVKLYVL